MSALSALPPPPLTTIRNETFFRVDVGWRCWQAARGWLCLTDAQRYYTTLQFWQVTGSADGVYPGYLARFSPYLVSYAGCGRDAHDPRGICNNLGCTHVPQRRAIGHRLTRQRSESSARNTLWSRPHGKEWLPVYPPPLRATRYASRNTHCSSVFVLLHQFDQIAVRVVAEADADGAFGQLKVDRA